MNYKPVKITRQPINDANLTNIKSHLDKETQVFPNFSHNLTYLHESIEYHYCGP